MNPGSGKKKKWLNIFMIVLLIVVAFIIGIVIGYFVGMKRQKESDKIENTADIEPEELRTQIHDEIKTENLRNNLKFLSERPHNAGTPGDERLANKIRSTWKDQGMDVKQYWYNVLLSFPDRASPNKVSLIDGTGGVRFSSQTVETPLTPGVDISDMIPPFNAYSPSGDVEAEVVYVNYGREEDFNLLKNDYGIDVRNKTVILRYGKLYRGNKVQLAADRGAVGVILYSDPADSAPYPSVSPYPDSWWFPPTGVQRGTIILSTGDPQTPGYPSIDSAYRIPEDKVDLPKIPCHAIGYGDAVHLLSRLRGPLAPPGWVGTIPGVTYRLGPGLNETGWKLLLHVSTQNKLVNTSNVIGFIRGSEEPDRYVLVGNHRDAWGFGAIDASSGTTVLLELSRVFSDMTKNGWRPRRTIVFCSWGAEEYGLIGSYEWVENYVSILAQRAVAYINIDVAVLGNHSIEVGGLPLLYDVIYDAAKQVQTPNADESLYTEWLRNSPKESKKDSGQPLPHIALLGSGSDFDAFVTFAGIPSIDLGYWYDTKAFNISYYPLYHSVYETYHAYETFLDPDFKYSQAIARFVGEMLRNLADSILLPLNAQTYGNEVENYVEALEKNYGDLLRRNNVSLNSLKEAARIFKEATKEFQDKREKIDKNDPEKVRAYNDQLMQLERAFVNPKGLPERPNARHILFAPSSKDSYSGAAFPGLVDLLFEIESAPSPMTRWELVRKHLAEVIYTVTVATSIVAPFTEI